MTGATLVIYFIVSGYGKMADRYHVPSQQACLESIAQSKITNMMDGKAENKAIIAMVCVPDEHK